MAPSRSAQRSADRGLPDRATAPTKMGHLIRIVLAAALALRADGESWSAATWIVGPIRANETVVLVEDCARIRAGRWVRIGAALANEEEAQVASVACPSPGARPARSAPPASEPIALPSLLELEPDPHALQPQPQPQQPLQRGVLQLAFGVLFDHARGERLLQHTEPPHPKPCARGCARHGKCDPRSGVCSCAMGWEGDACDSRVCAVSCGPHGRCVDGACACDEGWAAPTCAERACPAGCSGHGRCIDGACLCDDGWGGAACATLGDGCPNGCSRHGVCVRGRCRCYARHIGIDCATEINDCPGACSGGGLCRDGKCSCYPGYMGPDCGLSCPHNCSGLGTCLPPAPPPPAPKSAPASEWLYNRARARDASRHLRCECPRGVAGYDCSIECVHHCSGHGECEDGACKCDEGYIGDDCATCTAPPLLAAGVAPSPSPHRTPNLTADLVRRCADRRVSRSSARCTRRSASPHPSASPCSPRVRSSAPRSSVATSSTGACSVSQG